MITGKNIRLRPIQDGDWPILEAWGRDPDALWGPYQRFQLDHLPQLRQAYQAMGLLSREGGFLLAETLADSQVIGFVRYSHIPYPDADLPVPEIGFGIPEAAARGKGYAVEAVGLIVKYILAGYPTQRIMAFTEKDNLPAQRVLDKNHFQAEGCLRRAMYREGAYRDILIYARVRA